MSETPHAANLKALRHPTVIIGGLLFLGLLVLIGHYAIKGVEQRPERLLKAEVELYRISPRLDPCKAGMRVGVAPGRARAARRAGPAERGRGAGRGRAPRARGGRGGAGGAAGE